MDLSRFAIHIPETKPVIDQVREKFFAIGIQPPERMTLDGQLHRFSTNPKKPEDDSGYYCIHTDGTPAGILGDWRTGQEVQFRADLGRELTASEQMAINKRMFEAKKRRDEETKRKHEHAAETVAEIWEEARPVNEDGHTYLTKKGIQSHGSRIHEDGRLLCPMFDIDGNLSSVQYISTEEKRFHPGGKAGGSLWILGDIKEKVYIVEGFATGATIREAIDQPVVIAYSASNLPNVTGAIRTKYPTVQIVVVADHDLNGVGLNYATQASAKYGAQVIMPPTPGMDANDYQQSGGNLTELLNPRSTVFDRMKLIYASELPEEYHAPDEIIQGLLVRKSLSVLYGDSNSGKTFFALAIAHAVAEGKHCFGRKVKKGIVLYLATEAPGSIKSRLQAIRKKTGDSLENLCMVPIPLNFYSNKTDYVSVIELVKEIEKLKNEPVIMIIADTLARMSSGANENSGEDMAPVMENFTHVSDSTTAAVLIIHHNGKDAAKGSRGWSGIRAHIDTEIEVVESSGLRSATVTKQRELSSKGDIINFKLEVVEMGKGVFGDEISTCVAILDDEKREEKQKKYSLTDKLLKAFELTWKSGKELREGKPYITRSALKDFFRSQDLTETTIRNKLDFSRDGSFTKELICNGIISAHENGWVLDDLVAGAVLKLALEITPFLEKR